MFSRRPPNSSTDNGSVEPPFPSGMPLPVLRIHKANIRWWWVGFTLLFAAELAVSLIDLVFGNVHSGSSHPIDIAGIAVGAVVIGCLPVPFRRRFNRRLLARRSYFVGRAIARSLVRQGEQRPQGDLRIDANGITFEPDRSELFSNVSFRWTEIEQIELSSRIDRARLRLTLPDQRSQEFRVRDYYRVRDALETLLMGTADHLRSIPIS
jgi:hypothetical protein